MSAVVSIASLGAVFSGSLNRRGVFKCENSRFRLIKR